MKIKYVRVELENIQVMVMQGYSMLKLTTMIDGKQYASQIPVTDNDLVSRYDQLFDELKTRLYEEIKLRR